MNKEHMRKRWDYSIYVAAIMAILLFVTSIPIIDSTPVLAGPYENFEEGVKNAVINGESTPIYAWRYDIVRVEDAAGNVRPQDDPKRYYYYEVGDKIYLTATITPYIELPKFDIEYGRRGTKYPKVLWNLKPNETVTVDLPEPVVVQAGDIEFRGEKPIGEFMLSCKFTPYEPRTDLNPPYFPIARGDLFQGHNVNQAKLPDPDAPVIPKPSKTVPYTHEDDPGIAAEVTVAIQKVTDSNGVEIPPVDGRHVFLKAGDIIYPQYVLKNTGTKEISRLAFVIQDKEFNDLFVKQDFNVALPVGQYKIYDNLDPITVTEEMIVEGIPAAGLVTNIPLDSFVYFEGAEDPGWYSAYAKIYLDQGEAPLPPEEQGKTQWEDAAGLKFKRAVDDCFSKTKADDNYYLHAGVKYQHNNPPNEINSTIKGYLYKASEVPSDLTVDLTGTALAEQAAYGNGLLFLKKDRSFWKSIEDEDLVLVLQESYTNVKDGQTVFLEGTDPIPVPKYKTAVAPIKPEDITVPDNNNPYEHFTPFKIENLPPEWHTMRIRYGDIVNGEFIETKKDVNSSESLFGYDTVYHKNDTGGYYTQVPTPRSILRPTSEYEMNNKRSPEKITSIEFSYAHETAHTEPDGSSIKTRELLHGKYFQVTYIDEWCNVSESIVSAEAANTKADLRLPEPEGLVVPKNPNDHGKSPDGADVILKGVVADHVERIIFSIQSEWRQYTAKTVIFTRKSNDPNDPSFNEFEAKNYEYKKDELGKTKLVLSDDQSPVLEFVKIAEKDKAPGDFYANIVDPEFTNKKWIIAWVGNEHGISGYTAAQQQTFTWWEPEVDVPRSISSLTDPAKRVVTVRKIHPEDVKAEFYAVNPTTGEETLLTTATRQADGTWKTEEEEFEVQETTEQITYYDTYNHPYEFTATNLILIPDKGKVAENESSDLPAQKAMNKHLIKAKMWRPGDKYEHEGISERPWDDQNLLPGTYADAYTVTPQDISCELNGSPNASEGIKEMAESQGGEKLPDGTRVTYKEKPDTSTFGSKEVTLVVTFPDKSTKEVKTTLHVKPMNELYTPVYIGMVYKQFEPAKAEDTVAFRRRLPAGTQYTFIDCDSGEEIAPPDTSKPSDKDGDGHLISTYHCVRIKFPDGTSIDHRASMTVIPQIDKDQPDDALLEQVQRHLANGICKDAFENHPEALQDAEAKKEALRSAYEEAKNKFTDGKMDPDAKEKLQSALLAWEQAWTEANLERNPFREYVTDSEIRANRESYFFNLYRQPKGSNDWIKINASTYFNISLYCEPGDKIKVFFVLNPDPSNHYQKNIHLGFRFGGYTYEPSAGDPSGLSGIDVSKEYQHFEMSDFTLNGKPWDYLNALSGEEIRNNYYDEEKQQELGAQVSDENGMLSCTQYISLVLEVPDNIIPEIYTNEIQFSIMGGSENVGFSDGHTVKATANHSIFYLLTGTSMDFSYVLDKDYRLLRDGVYPVKVEEIAPRSPLDDTNPKMVKDYWYDGNSFVPLKFANQLADQEVFKSMWHRDNLLFNQRHSEVFYDNNYRGENQTEFHAIYKDWDYNKKDSRKRYGVGSEKLGAFNDLIKDIEGYFYVSTDTNHTSWVQDPEPTPYHNPTFAFGYNEGNPEGPYVRRQHFYLTYKPIPKALEIDKTLAPYGTALADVVFDLYAADENNKPTGEALKSGLTTDANGKFLSFSGDLSEENIEKLVVGSRAGYEDGIGRLQGDGENAVNGVYTLTEGFLLEPGKYVLVEREKPGVVKGEEILLTIDPPKRDEEGKYNLKYTVNVTNNAIPQAFEIEKHLFGKEEEKLAGAEFKLERINYDDSGNETGTTLLREGLKVNDEGIFSSADASLKDPATVEAKMQEDPKPYTIEQGCLYNFGDLGFLLAPGHYRITETKAPVGFFLDDAAHDFEIKLPTLGDAPLNSVKVPNIPKAMILQLEKLDAYNGNKLDGAEFSLSWIPKEGEAPKLVKEGIVIKDGNFKSFEGDLKTVIEKIKNGDLVAKDNLYDLGDEGFLIMAGQYALTETKTPDGYLKPDAPVRFEITNEEEGDLKLVQIKNEPDTPPPTTPPTEETPTTPPGEDPPPTTPTDEHHRPSTPPGTPPGSWEYRIPAEGRVQHIPTTGIPRTGESNVAIFSLTMMVLAAAMILLKRNMGK